MSTNLSAHWSRLLIAATFATVILPTGLAIADPPHPRQQPVLTIPPFIPPPVFCFRVTDITEVPADPEGNAFDFEFEVLNWTGTAAHGLELSKALDIVPATFGGTPILGTTPTVDTNGRPIGLGNDDGNFSPADGTGMPAKVGAANTWSPVSSSATQTVWRSPGGPGDALPFRDLLGAPGSSVAKTAAALGLVPGPANAVTFNRPVIPDFETVDNGAPGVDGLADNVRDGFVVRIDDFDIGETISLNWFLEDLVGAPIGTVAGGNGYGFGTFNFARGDDVPVVPPSPFDLPALWRRQPGNPFGPGQNSGQTMPTTVLIPPNRDMFVSTAPAGAVTEVFVVEPGAAITAPFANPLDQCPLCEINAEPVPAPQFINNGLSGFQSNPGLTLMNNVPGQIGTNPIRMQGLPGGLPCAGACDTIIQRLQPLDPLGPQIQQTQIQIVELQLQSIDPIDLGNGPEQFFWALDPVPQQQGFLEVDFVRMTFNYVLPINFELIGDVSGPFLQDLVVLQGSGQFSSDDITKFVAPGVNEFFFPLEFDVAGASSFAGIEVLQALRLPGKPGDYNQNGFVDLADFTFWADRLGQIVPPYTGADGDGDGVITSADLLVWVNNFQPGLPGAAQGDGSVPEPTSLVLLFGLASIGGVSRRLRLS